VATWWLSGYGIGFAIDGSWVRLPAGSLSSNNYGQVVRAHVVLSPSSTSWYRPRGGDAMPLGRGKVTVGLASHWPCVTDLSGSSTFGLNGLDWEMSTQPIRSALPDTARFTFLTEACM